MESLEDLARRRVLALYDKPGADGEKWTAEKLAPFLGMTDPSGVRKLLAGLNRISLAHLQGFCEAFCITPSEMLAPDGATFTHLKDSEPLLIRIYRDMNEHARHSLLTVLTWRPSPIIGKGRRSRLGRTELTSKEQELVDYFSRVKKPGVREGVLETLRGAAQDEPVERRRTHE